MITKSKARRLYDLLEETAVATNRIAYSHLFYNDTGKIIESTETDSVEFLIKEAKQELDAKKNIRKILHRDNAMKLLVFAIFAVGFGFALSLTN